MFGLFKPKPAPEGPIDIVTAIEIDRPVEEVFALVDWADPRNAKRVTGNTVRAVEGKPDQFEMVMSHMDDLLFRFVVTQNEPGRNYAYGCVIEPPVGRMAHSHESYEFEALGDDRCSVAMVCQATFVDGMTEKEWTGEVANMSAAVQSSLQKLKLQAEHGAEVAKAVQENTLL